MFDRQIELQINKCEYEITEKDKDGSKQKDCESDTRMTRVGFDSNSIVKTFRHFKLCLPQCMKCFFTVYERKKLTTTDYSIELDWY